MNREDIIRMAREVGIDPESDTLCNYDGWVDTLVDFAVLVAAAEREACANIDWTPILRNGGVVTWGDAETLADLVSAAIRSKGPA